MKKEKRPIYMYQCVVCRESILTEDTTFRHCGKLTQWINGIEGKGIDMNSPQVKIEVKGYITMSQENLERIMTYKDPHMGLVYSMHMGFVDSSNLEFKTPD